MTFARKLTIVMFAFFSIWAIADIAAGRTDWIVDRFYLALISLGAFFLHKRMHLSNYALVVGLLPVIMHAFGRYEMVWFSLPYDFYLHLAAGFAIGMIFFEYFLEKKLPSRITLAVLVTAGIGSLLEILEFTGYLVGGAGSGIFFYGTGDYGDWANAIQDMFSNTVGALLASTIYAIVKKPQRIFAIVAVACIVFYIAEGLHARAIYSQVELVPVVELELPRQHHADLRKLLDEPISYFAKGDTYLVLGRLENSKRTICQSIPMYEEYLKTASPEMQAVTHETIASLHCPNAKQGWQYHLENASAIWKGLGNSFRADIDYRLANDEPITFYLRPYEIRNVTEADNIVGNYAIRLSWDDLLVTQVDRVTRDWLSAQIQAPDDYHLLRVFSEKYTLDDLQEGIGWHEGARVDELRQVTYYQTATGTLAKRFGDTWYAPDEKGIFRFEISPDKIEYPTTRYLRDDLAVVVDTHGISMLVEQAVRSNATAVLGCCDYIGKVKAAQYLAGKGIKVICPTDRMLPDIMGTDNVVGSAPILVESDRAIIGARPIDLTGRPIVATNASDEIYGVMYYDTPARYFSHTVLDVYYFNVTDFGQMGSVIEYAESLNASVIGVRVYNEDDYVHVRDWLQKDVRHVAVLFHSEPYPYGYRLFDEYASQTTFGDLK